MSIDINNPEIQAAAITAAASLTGHLGSESEAHARGITMELAAEQIARLTHKILEQIKKKANEIKHAKEIDRKATPAEKDQVLSALKKKPYQTEHAISLATKLHYKISDDALRQLKTEGKVQDTDSQGRNKKWNVVGK